jgi:hypothetical protein
MRSPLPVWRRLWRRRYIAAYAALAASLVAHVAEFYHPDTGFSALILFGDAFESSRLGRLREVPIYTVAGDGFDGQFYAQIAVAGNPFDPELATAIEWPAYRTARALVPVLAHLAGLGRPARVVDAYALINVFAWLVLAVLLARWWFPPRELHDLVRWAGTLFGAGMMASVSRSLVDGPALLLLACAVRAIERERRLLGAVLLGVAGLARGTSVLAAPALLPTHLPITARAWLRLAALLAICALPVVAWVAILRAHFGYPDDPPNLALPLSALPGKLREIRDAWRSGGFARAQHEIWAVLAIATQVGFMLARPRPRELWWRIGIAFALLAVCLGPTVWEGFPSSPPRVLLPLTLAFNVLVPRTRAGLVLLLAGNLTVLSATTLFQSPSRAPESTLVAGVSVSHSNGWYDRETEAGHRWRWAARSARLRLRNAAASDRLATLEFEIGSVTERTVVIQVGGIERRVAVSARQPTSVRLGPVTLQPGTTLVDFATDAPAWQEPGGRKLSYSVRDLSVR